MKSLILSTATRYLFPLLLLYSVFLLYRGHNEPGGGFIGGLVAVAAFALHMIAHGVAEARRGLNVHPWILVGLGLTAAAGSGVLGLLAGGPYMSGMWLGYEVPAVGKLGTPLLFDVGVYLVVVGIVLTILFSLAED